VNLRIKTITLMLLISLSACAVPQRVIPVYPIAKGSTVDAGFSINSSRWWQQTNGFVNFEVAFSIDRDCKLLSLGGDVFSGATVIGKLSTYTENVTKNTIQIKRGIISLEAALPPSTVFITSYKCS
jgi:hypothetical protein